MVHCDYCQRDNRTLTGLADFKNNAGDTVRIHWCDECDERISRSTAAMTPCAKCGAPGQTINGVSLCPKHASAYVKQFTVALPKPRKAPAKPTKPAASPTVVQAPAPEAAAAPQHVAPVPATAQPQAPATAPTTSPTNTVDWARDARRRGWAVLHGMPEQQLRAYQTRVEYLVSYPAAIAELARIESSRYWITVNVRKAM